MINTVKKRVNNLKIFFHVNKEKFLEEMKKINTNIKEDIDIVIKRTRSDIKERNRLIIVFFASIFMLNYVMFCYLVNKNIFDIFPSIPLLENKENINVYLPSLDGNRIVKEQRSVPQFDSDERYANYLFNTVTRGSIYENTATIVPVKLFIRKTWIFSDDKSNDKKACVFDIEPAIFEDDPKIIKNSEELFKKAVEKTVVENIKTIKKVYFLEKGVPDKGLWEL